MNYLGGMYYRMLQDYARAAYWWRRAGVEKNDGYGHGVAVGGMLLEAGQQADGPRIARSHQDTVRDDQVAVGHG